MPLPSGAVRVANHPLNVILGSDRTPIGFYGDAGDKYFVRIDPVTGQAVDKDGNPVGAAAASISPVVKPWLLAPIGDSRSSVTGQAFAPSGIWSALSAETGNFSLSSGSLPVQLASAMGDAEVSMDFGDPGEMADQWNNPTRGGAATQKGIQYLTASQVEIVYVQYGLQSVLVSYTGSNYAGVMATIVGQLKSLFVELIKAGKYVIWDSMWPFFSSAGYPATQTFTATKLQMCQDINVQMSAFVQSFGTKVAVYVDTTPYIADPVTGYARTDILTDGLHPGGETISWGIAQYIIGKIRQYIPLRPGIAYARNAALGQPNLIDQIAPTVFLAQETGTCSAPVYSTGIDNGEYYHQWTYTPTALNTGIQRVRFEIHANVGSQNGTPFYYVQPGDVLQGSGKVLVDNGAGGASPVALAIMRLQAVYFSGTVFSFGETGGGTPQAQFLPPVERRLPFTPTVQIASTGSADIQQPSSGKGVCLQFYVTATAIGTPVRFRVKTPMIRKVGYSTYIRAVTAPASGAPYTNTSGQNQQVIVSGGTVSAISINGVATGLISGSFALAPLDTLTPTYTVVPTILAKQV